MYLASVADSMNDIDRVTARLSTIAREHSMFVLMSNYVGTCNGWAAAGKTSVWNKKGELLSQLDDASEGIIVMDTETHDVSKRTIAPVEENTYRWNVTAAASGYDQAAEHIHPHYIEIQDAILGALPFDGDDVFTAVDAGGGSGRLVERILDQTDGTV